MNGNNFFLNLEAKVQTGVRRGTFKAVIFNLITSNTPFTCPWTRQEIRNHTLDYSFEISPAKTSSRKTKTYEYNAKLPT